jgi:hypothetical protein
MKDDGEGYVAEGLAMVEDVAKARQVWEARQEDGQHWITGG